MKKMIVCNQKMFLDKVSAEKLRNDMIKLDLSKVNFVVCPSFLDFDIFKDFTLGAQDAFYLENGPYTSEVSARSLSSHNVKYSLIGHSYRRKYDTDEVINLKVKAILKNNMKPIICVGETKEEYDSNMIKEVLKKQINKALDGVVLKNKEEIIIAYEPVWMVGSDKVLDKGELNKVIIIIRNILKELNIINYKLLYGGSVTYDGIQKIGTCTVDGYLLGRASVKIEELKKIINYTENM